MKDWSFEKDGYIFECEYDQKEHWITVKCFELVEVKEKSCKAGGTPANTKGFAEVLAREMLDVINGIEKEL